ncbi:amidohydrolase family protein [Leifsonia bigeumensis]|uniref:Amidohydrolase family protein n=1 Tax=Leifsonella bigeumensis TaxID=433643 RepID=A0ABP7F9D5_9MICO
MEPRQVLRNATIVDGGGRAPFRADLSIVGGRIDVVGAVQPESGDVEVECTGRFILPGFIDTHSHADGQLFRSDVQLALLRQGVTTVIGGQDGVSYAPGDGRFASEYFAAINGAHPSYRGSSVAELLATYDDRTALNFAYLVPAGTVRHEVMGRSPAPADLEQLGRMTRLVEEGIRDGAIGLSTGLDYVPGIYADSDELAALCRPVARAGAIYVSHMRGGYETNSAAGLEEVVEICLASGVRAHVSHFHAPADILVALMSSLAGRGMEITFDAYPYTRGCTLLGMPLLPPELAIRPVEEIVAELARPEVRDRLRRDWFPRVARQPSLGPDWPAMITLGHIAAAAEYDWAHGLTLAEASERVGQDPVTFSLDLLVASRLEVNAVMAVRHPRPVEELGRILSHPRHVGGSDGIFVGAHPHPRGYGTFARFLRRYTREEGFYDWPTAAVHLAAGPAELFGFADRGRLVPGAVADIVVLDPDRVADHATYDEPRALATGIDDVFVRGVRVLDGGALTGAHPGRGLRRRERAPHQRNAHE